MLTNLDAFKILSLSPRTVVLKVATTGTTPTDEAIEVLVMDLQEQPLFHTLVKPNVPVNPGAAAYHGITDEMLNDAPTWATVWPQLQEVLEGKRVAIYGTRFDVSKIQRGLFTWGLNLYQETPLLFHTMYDWECVMTRYIGAMNHDYNQKLLAALQEQKVDCSGLPSEKTVHGFAARVARLIHAVAQKWEG